MREWRLLHGTLTFNRRWFMRHVLYALSLLTFIGSSMTPASAAVFQFVVPVETERGEHQAFLWLPAEAEQVRGVVMAGMTSVEPEFVQDERIRAACAEQQLAMVFLTCGLGAADVQQVLSDLAEASGYRELAVAPLMFMGHSAGGPQARALAVALSDRCFGLISYRGGGPWDGEPLAATVPSVSLFGQFDEFYGLMRDADGRESWWRVRDALAAFRAADERRLASILIEPGRGHFGWSDRNATYLAQFIARAAARIPETWPIETAEPVALHEIDHRGGWLTDLAIEAADAAEPAPYEAFTGNRERTAWHFDRELAEATVAYHAGLTGKADQFLRWADRHWVDAGVRHFFMELTWVDDGQTLQVHPTYATQYPLSENGPGPRWHQAGAPVGHADASIRVRPVSGPLVAEGERRLRIQHDALAPAGASLRGTFLAYSEGDDAHRYTELVGMLPRGFRGLDRGQDQAITFQPLDDIAVDSEPVALNATSDADLPVAYYIAYGPARVVDGQLKVAEVPARAALPIEVKIVAYQFGRGVEPQIETAAPVVQTLRIVDR